MLILFSISCIKDPLPNDQITDIDGNVYHSVVIGTQEWLVENLRVTTLNDGTPINLVTANIEWPYQVASAYCWYYNIPNENGINGALYNWYTVNTGKLCIDGWHVPSDGEWKTLEIYLGMSQNDADKLTWRGEGLATLLKATDYWYVLNGVGDTYGFKAIPAGYRFFLNGNYEGYEQSAIWWTSTDYDPDRAYFRNIITSESSIYRGSTIKTNGFSVRCIKN